MKKLTVLIIAGIMLAACLPIGTGCANLKQWSKVEKAELGLYALGSAIDARQTRRFIKEDRELNPMFKNNTDVIAIKALALGIIFLVSDKNDKARPYLLGTANAVQWGIVDHNKRVR